jgi:hypothetical protein
VCVGSVRAAQCLLQCNGLLMGASRGATVCRCAKATANAAEKKSFLQTEMCGLETRAESQQFQRRKESGIKVSVSRACACDVPSMASCWSASRSGSREYLVRPGVVVSIGVVSWSAITICPHWGGRVCRVIFPAAAIRHPPSRRRIQTIWCACALQSSAPPVLSDHQPFLSAVPR